MTNPTHTEGKLEYQSRFSGSENHRGFDIYAPSQTSPVAHVMPFDEDGHKGQANAARLVHCWNHLPEVEAERDRLLVALDHIAREPLTDDAEASDRDCLDEAVSIAQAAITKAKQPLPDPPKESTS